MSKAEEAGRNADKATAPLVNKMVRALALEAMMRIMLKNPVDTGRSRANWNVSIGEPDTRAIWNLTVNDWAAREALGAATIEKANFFSGDELYITNGIEYIKRLEEGYSKQAPQGMVGVTVAELRPVADEIARRLSRA